MTKHEENIKKYRELGGNENEILNLKFPSLQNRAKLVYLIKQIDSSIHKISNSEDEKLETIERNNCISTVEVSDIESTPSHKMLGFISQYSVELHETYNKAFNSWLKACSLKIQLNAITQENEPEAYRIQCEIFNEFKSFDSHKKVLDFYNENKRLMPTDTISDFTNLKPLKLLQKRNNLRGLITRRRQTIEKKEAELPDKENVLYQKRLSALNKKKEELQELMLDLEKLNGLIK